MRLEAALVAQFIKFGLVGGINTALHYAVFYALYSLMGFYYLSASAIGYLAGLFNSYLLNRSWTFKVRDTNCRVEFTKFFCVNVVSLGVNLVAMKMFVVWGNLPPEIAQVLAIGFSVVLNFLGNRMWTFNTAKDARL